jgi:excinuclease ABC subunit A
MRDLGNTLIVVEHDEETMRNADYLVDIGPGAGVHGGEVVASGSVQDIENALIRSPAIILRAANTSRFLPNVIKAMARRSRSKGRSAITSRISMSRSLGDFHRRHRRFGSGKSSLVNETLYKAIQKKLTGEETFPGAFDSISGLEAIDKVVNVTQEPIGRTPRSNPATYTKVFDDIRDLFAETPEAKERGFTKGRFSFNVPGGRCEKCQGAGVVYVPMNFLPDVYVKCDECDGMRYNQETLSCYYKGKNIYDVLEMRVEEAMHFFEARHEIYRKIKTLYDVGLGYIKLGQPATTLSGGEAQRIKLAFEFSGGRPARRFISSMSRRPVFIAMTSNV